MKKSFIQNHKKAGFALLLSIIIASVVLAIGISILKISVSQLQLSATGRESEISFQSAQSIAECMTYWRYANRRDFVARPGNFQPGVQLNAPNMNCMGENPVESFAQVVANRDDRHIVRFHYVFEWGHNSEYCSSGDMYIMVPLVREIVHTFEGTMAGENGDGMKRCQGGSVCTVLITQGYNRPCDELRSSIFTVQREITTEF